MRTHVAQRPAAPKRRSTAVAGHGQPKAAPVPSPQPVESQPSGGPAMLDARGYFEPRFGGGGANHVASRPVARLLGSWGHPLGGSGIRIHTGDAAAASAQAMQARAYTYGPDMVFNRGEYDPSGALFAHELGHALRQSSPASYRLAFQKQPAAPAKFFKEVEDAIASLQGSAIPDPNLPYLRDLLALSKAVEAQDKSEATRLTPLVVAASPASAVPVARSDEFVNELITRAFLMGLDAEAASLRTFFRRLAAVPSRRGPTDAKFGADKALFQGLVTRTMEMAKFGTAGEATASIDSLLNTFRIVAGVARSIDFKEVERERKANYSAGAFYTPDTLDSFFGTLIGQLGVLATPIFHGLDTMMTAAIADLEADKGTKSLAAAKSVMSDKIEPAYKGKIGDENLLDLVVEATRSTFGPTEGRHFDFFDKSKAAEKRSVVINYFDKTQTTGFSDKLVPVGYVILSRKQQVSFLESLYVAGNRAAMGTSPLKLESVDSWRSFLHAKVLELRKAGKKDDEVLLAVIKFLSGYLETFTASTPFNIEDVIRKDDENYNKRLLPRDIAGRLIEDCGVYALRTVYMLSLVKSDLNLRIRFIYLPVHVGLIITGGKDMPTLIAHNNKIYPIDATQLGREKATWAAKDPTKPTTDDQFIGEVAASFFTPGVDVPFRLEEAPAIVKNDPKEKEKLQQYYEGTLKKDVLADAPKAGITQFHLEYLRLNDEAKKMYNSVVVPIWNSPARTIWLKHRDKLFAELAKARDGKPDTYAAASAAYLAELDATFKPVDDAMAAAAQSRQGVSATLAAHPELTGATATRGFGSRVGFKYAWQVDLAAHKAAIRKLTDIKDPGKPAFITPPFSEPKGFLLPFH